MVVKVMRVINQIRSDALWLRNALAEDIGSGDVTSLSIVPARAKGRGKLIAKAEGIFCGREVAEQIWKLVSPKVKLRWKIKDGERVKPGQVLMELEGPYRALLAGERVALNFMQRLSGIATFTRQMVDEAAVAAKSASTKTSAIKPPAICDPRKTTPLWRALERHAVKCGGGTNHRFGLFDMILIKETHARAAGSVGRAITLARSKYPKLKIAAEATNEREVREAIRERADLILLDNMTPAQIKRIAQKHHGAGIPFEISGGVNLKNIRAYARMGADRISIGALTHSAPALDLSLQLYPEKIRKKLAQRRKDAKAQ